MQPKSHTEKVLSAQDRRDAKEALQILEPFGLTLTGAALLATGGTEKLDSEPVGSAVDRYLREKRPNIRAATFLQYENVLGHLTDAFPDALVSEITTDRVAEFLDASSSAGTHAAVRAFFRWAMRQRPPLTRKDPCEQIARPSRKKQSSEIQFLSVDEVRETLPKCGHHIPALALALFAGIRTQELGGLDKDRVLWRHVNAEERVIRIPGSVAKTGRPRILEGLPENIWSWLRDRGEPNEPVCPGRGIEAVRRFQVEAGYRDAHSRKALRPWPQNALRHSFATYGVAYYQDVARVSIWLGHEGNPSLLHRHYRGLASKKEAAGFFGTIWEDLG